MACKVCGSQKGKHSYLIFRCPDTEKTLKDGANRWLDTYYTEKADEDCANIQQQIQADSNPITLPNHQ